MTTITETKPWDFSHVLDLVNSLSPSRDDSKDGFTSQYDNDTVNRLDTRSDNEEPSDSFEHQRGLGDFSKLWQLLGSPASSPAPAPAVQPPPSYVVASPKLQISRHYASDGAIGSQTVHSNKQKKKKENKKAVDLQIESSAAYQAADTVSDGSAVPDSPTLTKTQRKKQRRKERREEEAALAESRNTWDASWSAPESEARTVSHQVSTKEDTVVNPTTPPQSHSELRQQRASAKSVPAKVSRSPLEAAALAIQRVEEAKKANSLTTPRPKTSGAQSNTPISKSTQDSNLALLSKNGNSSNAHHTQRNEQRPLSTPGNVNATQFVPATVQPPKFSATRPVSVRKHVPNPTNTAAFVNGIQPLLNRSSEDRHWSLLMRLLADFYPDRSYLVSPMNLTTHNNDPKGIHVFVDASNIFIGFNDQLKRSRGIPQHVQIPPVGLSFDALALLMERRRPVAKRVLVGSTPYLPAFDKAKAVGYECSILEKVYKARELTERQIFFKEQDYARRVRKRAKAPPANTVATVNGGPSSGSGSSSETTAPQYAPARMIEQGVDEILHLKILESIVDTDVPGTIVLATGDAAQAEYSEGFMAMAERALKKGWSVELVSWSANISAMYTKHAWTQAWGKRFRIVTLDDYAEELLDM